MDEKDLAKAIESLLGDPDTEKKISEMIDGLSSDEKESDPSFDITKLLKLKGLFDESMGEDDPKVSLLSSLRPYISKEKEKNLDSMII